MSPDHLNEISTLTAPYFSQSILLLWFIVFIASLLPSSVIAGPLFPKNVSSLQAGTLVCSQLYLWYPPWFLAHSTCSKSEWMNMCGSDGCGSIGGWHVCGPTCLHVEGQNSEYLPWVFLILCSAKAWHKAMDGSSIHSNCMSKWMHGFQSPLAVTLYCV